MAGKIKGIYKGFKSITQIFVVKERKMEIGQPTDVIHVAHISVDNSSTVDPSWMNEFNNSSNRTTKSTDNNRVSHRTTLSAQSSPGIDRSMRSQSETERMRNRSCSDLSNIMEKRQKRKKVNSIIESSSTKPQ